jgi:hypothetical protein
MSTLPPRRFSFRALWLVGRVLSLDPDEHMPPKHEGEPLNPSQVRVLQEWISAGAPAPSGEQPESDPREHWAFRPPARPPVPSVENREWVANPIDAFISARHAAKGIVPQACAPRGILVRRLFIDLVGVPPSLAETAAINAMPDSEWYPALVEKLLADPRHGQRWARHWMDVCQRGIACPLGLDGRVPERNCQEELPVPLDSSLRQDAVRDDDRAKQGGRRLRQSPRLCWHLLLHV